MASKDTPSSIEDIFKSAGNLDADGKLKLLSSKYEELVQLFRSQENHLHLTKRELGALNIDKNKQILARSRLEGVCRQLQKQNKTIKDENLLKLRDEEERRKKVTQEFQKTLNNLTLMMTESNAQNSKLGDENRQMAQRLGSIYDEFKTRENEIDRISKQIDIERQLADARCAKIKTEFLIEKQTILSENEGLSAKVAQLTKDLIDATNKSIALERQVMDVTAQLNQYTDKYEEFESTITKSGKVFDHCKIELNRMTKQVKSLEKEVIEWQTRYHKSVNTVYEVQVENNEKKKVIHDLNKKQNQLTKLCRQLQSERQAYMNTLRDLGKDPKDILVEPPADDPMIEELTKSLPINLAAGDADEARFGAKHKPVLKAKRGKQKGKRGREVSFDNASQLTPKEIELAELKLELRRVQHLIQLESQAGEIALPDPKAAVIPLDSHVAAGGDAEFCQIEVEDLGDIKLYRPEPRDTDQREPVTRAPGRGEICQLQDEAARNVHMWHIDVPTGRDEIPTIQSAAAGDAGIGQVQTEVAGDAEDWQLVPDCAGDAGISQVQNEAVGIPLPDIVNYVTPVTNKKGSVEDLFSKLSLQDEPKGEMEPVNEAVGLSEPAGFGNITLANCIESAQKQEEACSIPEYQHEVVLDDGQADDSVGASPLPVIGEQNVDTHDAE